MNGNKLKKQLILNLPYILIGLYATKLGEAWRLAEGADVSQKFLHLMDGFTAAFQSPLPSFHPSDLLIGMVIGCVLRLLVYEKSRNAKKYRRNEEYGSARWGTEADIKPFVDPKFENISFPSSLRWLQVCCPGNHCQSCTGRTRKSPRSTIIQFIIPVYL